MTIDLFLEMMAAERGAAANTLESYRRDIEQFQAFYHTTHRKTGAISEASREDVTAYIRSLSDAGFAASTVSRRISMLRQFFQFLYTDGVRADNPMVDIETPKRASNLPKCLTEEEVGQLLHTVYAAQEPKQLRLAALMEILYASGIRVSELIGLKLASVQEGHLLVKGKGNKERLAPLNGAAMRTIRAYIQCRESFIPSRRKDQGWLFPSRSESGHLTRQQVALLLKQLAKEAGVDARKVSPHIMRHSFASHLLNRGMDLRILQELLGHSDISTTQIYTHLSNDTLKKLVEEKHPLQG